MRGILARVSSMDIAATIESIIYPITDFSPAYLIFVIAGLIFLVCLLFRIKVKTAVLLVIAYLVYYFVSGFMGRRIALACTAVVFYFFIMSLFERG